MARPPLSIRGVDSYPALRFGSAIGGGVLMLRWFVVVAVLAMLSVGCATTPGGPVDPSPSATPTPSSTPTPSATPTPSESPTPSATSTPTSTPTPTVAPQAPKNMGRVGAAGEWSVVSTGYWTTCGIKKDHSLWCWGNNTYGSLGDGTTVNKSAPSRVGVDSDWATVSTSSGFTCGIKLNGTLWCWGMDGLSHSEYLGYDYQYPHENPWPIGFDSDWKSVSVGPASAMSACALKNNGSLWCWGLNGKGQVGDGTRDFRMNLTEITPGVVWKSVEMGGGQACGIRSDNSLWCWGGNQFGELGTGDQDPRLVPTRIGTDTDWKSLSLAESRTCAVKQDSSAWCWGADPYSPYDPSATPPMPIVLTPTRVHADKTFEQYSTGFPLDCGISTDSSLWCWNQYQGPVVGSAEILVDPATGWSTHSGRLGHNCGIEQSGSLWCWADNNNYGALGHD